MLWDDVAPSRGRGSKPAAGCGGGGPAGVDPSRGRGSKHQPSHDPREGYDGHRALARREASWIDASTTASSNADGLCRSDQAAPFRRGFSSPLTTRQVRLAKEVATWGSLSAKVCRPHRRFSHRHRVSLPAGSPVFPEPANPANAGPASRDDGWIGPRTQDTDLLPAPLRRRPSVRRDTRNSRTRTPAPSAHFAVAFMMHQHSTHVASQQSTRRDHTE